MTYVEWLEKQGFVKSPVVGEDGTEFWSRPTKYGVVRCRTNGDNPIEIAISRDPYTGHFRMSVMGDNGKYWMDCAAWDLSEDVLMTKGRDIEMRLVDAWRGFN